MSNFAVAILFLIIGIALFEGGLYYLHIKRFKMDIATDLQELYHPSTYQRFIKREKKKFYVAITRLVLQIALFMTFILTGLYLQLNDLVISNVRFSPFQSIAYISGFFLLLFMIEILVHIFEVFFIKKQKASKAKIRQISVTLFKKFLIWFFITIPLLGIFLMLYDYFGVTVFIISFIVIEVLIVLASLFFTKLIVTKFYKLTPLQEGELRERIRIFLDQEGYQIEDVYILNQGRRSNELNAFISGFSKRKRIVLFDTLIKKLTYDEIIAVIAHELGHQKHHHIISNISLSWILVSVFLGLFYWLLTDTIFFTSFDFPFGHYGFIMLIGYFLLDFLVLLARTLITIRSRSLEFQADSYERKVWYNISLQRALIKIARQNIEHLTPHPLYVLIYYTHPVLKDRFARLIEEEK